MASVPVPLDEASLRAHFLGRPAYRRTRYIVARAAGTAAAGPGLTALVDVTRRSDVPLFSEITGLALIAGPDETAFVDAPEADTGIPTSLSKIAADRAPGARCVVVRGRYGHVGFIVDPAPVRVTVVEVVPPHPAKLVDQARRVLGLAEDLPPVELVPELTDLRALAGSHPAEHYLFPCRAGTAVAGAAVSYLDEIPPEADWTLVGCARSRDIHDWFYQRDVPVVDMCPRNLALRAVSWSCRGEPASPRSGRGSAGPSQSRMPLPALSGRPADEHPDHGFGPLRPSVGDGGDPGDLRRGGQAAGVAGRHSGAGTRAGCRGSHPGRRCRGDHETCPRRPD